MARRGVPGAARPGSPAGKGWPPSRGWPLIGPGQAVVGEERGRLERAVRDARGVVVQVRERQTECDRALLDRQHRAGAGALRIVGRWVCRERANAPTRTEVRGAEALREPALQSRVGTIPAARQ